MKFIVNGEVAEAISGGGVTDTISDKLQRLRNRKEMVNHEIYP